MVQWCMVLMMIVSTTTIDTRFKISVHWLIFYFIFRHKFGKQLVTGLLKCLRQYNLDHSVRYQKRQRQKDGLCIIYAE